MSLDAYIERQDRTFDTFRNQFCLENAAPNKHHRSRSSLSRIADRHISTTSTLEETVDVVPEVIDAEAASVQLSFTPQMRRLESAPWETNSTITTTTTKSTTATKAAKVKKPRSGLFSKLRRVTSGTKSFMDTNSLAGADKENIEIKTVKAQVDSHPPSPGLGLFSATGLFTMNRSNVPLGRPLDFETVQELEKSIVFQPVDSNVLHLKQSIAVIPEDDGDADKDDDEVSSVMRPSPSTPQISYEFAPTSSPKDRMSRMFDNLQFE